MQVKKKFKSSRTMNCFYFRDEMCPFQRGKKEVSFETPF